MEDLPRPEFWDWFQSRQEAAAAQRPLASSTVLVAVSMRGDEVRLLMDDMGGVADQPWFELVRTATPADGELLGYEVVGAEHTLDFHSWHCHGYADEVSETLGIRVNELGLLASYDDARAVRDWMLARPPGEEPSPVPWVVVGLHRPTPS